MTGDSGEVATAIPRSRPIDRLSGEATNGVVVETTNGLIGGEVAAGAAVTGIRIRSGVRRQTVRALPTDGA